MTDDKPEPTPKSSPSPDRPDILEVVGRYFPLRRSGREYKGCCPFHDDKHPSFSVNPDKQVFYCHPCAIGGDVVRFIELVEGLSFREALLQLGMRQDKIQRPRNDAVKRLAETVSPWANEQFDKAQSLLREIGQRERIAQELGWIDEIERCKRERDILICLSNDLQDVTQVIELWEERESIEAILVDMPDEPLPTYPAITPEYRARLQAVIWREHEPIGT
ncbi:MAG: hypothetical protein HYY45_15145 [Deltaproteobacteria bacterium]|nr:hypothetical protein [Deltaproteobacteria bacterium]